MTFLRTSVMRVDLLASRTFDGNKQKQADDDEAALLLTLPCQSLVTSLRDRAARMRSSFLFWILPCVFAFVERTTTRHRPNFDTKLFATDDNPWIKQGLLISSFSQGLEPNLAAHDVLRRGLVRTVLTQEQQRLEAAVQTSAEQSPCCGPTNLMALESLQALDEVLEQLETHPSPAELWHRYCPGVLRVVYIPTAMYAVRPESQNTPGKQRQRARADAKKRRNEIVGLLHKLLNNNNDVCIQTVTLDLDDGSIKQPECSMGTSRDFPTTGKEALREWKPHLVYIQGGNSFWLHYCMTRGQWQDDLVKLLCADTFYIGSSAGAILVGSTMQTACWKEWDDPRVVPEMSRNDDWENVPGLGLVGNAAFFPHMQQEWQATVQEKSRTFPNLKICTLADNEACHVSGDRKETMIYSVSVPEMVGPVV